VHVSGTYVTAGTGVVKTLGDVCLEVHMSRLDGPCVVGMGRRARIAAFQRWAHPSIQATTNLKAFAATHYQGADP
jgi:hypothetical protein